MIREYFDKRGREEIVYEALLKDKFIGQTLFEKAYIIKKKKNYYVM